MKVAFLLIADAATLYMAGVNWFLQVVHHPLYDRIGRETFAEYETANPPPLQPALLSGDVRSLDAVAGLQFLDSLREIIAHRALGQV
jgi:hypothetical protein